MSFKFTLEDNNREMDTESLKLQETFYLSSNLAIDMWTSHYYKLLSIIGNDYE